MRDIQQAYSFVKQFKDRLDALPCVPVGELDDLEARMRSRLTGTDKPPGSLFMVYAPAPEHGEPDWRIFEDGEDFRTAAGRRFKGKLAMQDAVFTLRRSGHEVQAVGFPQSELEPGA